MELGDELLDGFFLKAEFADQLEVLVLLFEGAGGYQGWVVGWERIWIRMKVIVMVMGDCVVPRYL